MDHGFPQTHFLAGLLIKKNTKEKQSFNEITKQYTT
jgi:hypothetical protein